MTAEDWHDRHRRTLGMYLADDARTGTTTRRSWSGSTAVRTRSHVQLPDGGWADTYTVVAHTGDEGELPTEKIPAELDPAHPRSFGRRPAGGLTSVPPG